MTRDVFVKVISELVVKENKKRGYPLFSSVVIAQAICESAWRTVYNYDESKRSIWNKSRWKLEG